MDFPTLITAARNGQEDARAALLELYHPRIQALVRLRATSEVKARESHSDLVQSACRHLLTSFEHFDGSSEGEFRSWLYSLVQRTLIDRHRFHTAQKRRPERGAAVLREDVASALLEGYAHFCTPSREAVAREEVERVETALMSLSDEHREAIVQAYVVGLSRRDIAHNLGKSEVSVRQLLVRARARLATLLDGQA